MTEPIVDIDPRTPDLTTVMSEPARRTAFADGARAIGGGIVFVEGRTA
jgi:hypothetical protein